MYKIFIRVTIHLSNYEISVIRNVRAVERLMNNREQSQKWKQVLPVALSIKTLNANGAWCTTDVNQGWWVAVSTDWRHLASINGNTPAAVGCVKQYVFQLSVQHWFVSYYLLLDNCELGFKSVLVTFTKIDLIKLQSIFFY